LQRFLRKRRKLGNKGFTLIELIVVIAVIGILVLLAAPKFLGYTRDAKVAALQSDVKTLSNAVLLYNIESEDDRWPFTEDTNDADGGLLDYEVAWADIPYGLQESLKDKDSTIDTKKIVLMQESALDPNTGIMYKYIKNLNNPISHYIVVVEGSLEGEVFHIGPNSATDQTNDPPVYVNAGQIDGDRKTTWYGVDANVTVVSVGDDIVTGPTTFKKVNGVDVP
jgi:prepilin-type N-terminal cleavage/methylation domain-containing protein